MSAERAGILLKTGRAVVARLLAVALQSGRATSAKIPREASALGDDPLAQAVRPGIDYTHFLARQGSQDSGMRERRCGLTASMCDVASRDCMAA